MKIFTESQVKNTKEKFQNELIRRNRIKKDNDIFNAWYYGGITYNGIKDIRYLFNEHEDEYEDIKYLFNENEDVDENKESPSKSIIVDIKNKLSKNGHKLMKKGLYYVEEMKTLGPAEVKNIKVKLIIFKNELIRKNRINNSTKKILTIAMEILNKYLLNENEDKDIKRDAYYTEQIKKNKIKTTYKEDIKRGLYYVEKMSNLSISDTKNIK